MSDLTCIHRDSGLCPACRADYDTDPAAWLEFGSHPEGLTRMAALEADMAEEARREREAEARQPPLPECDSDIPW